MSAEGSIAIQVYQPVVIIPAPIISKQPASQTLCLGANVKLSVTATGEGTLQYQWKRNGASIEGATQNELNFNLSADKSGTYLCEVSNAGGATISQSAIVAASIPEFEVVITPIKCAGESGGLSIIAAAGTPPYSYSLDGAAYNTVTKYEQKAAGTYLVAVKDKLGCEVRREVTISEPANKLTANAELVKGISCNGSSDAVIEAKAVGTGVYTYTLTKTEVTNENGRFSGLAAGEYTITVKDQRGCSATVQQTVTEPTALNAQTTVGNVSCYGLRDASIAATLDGGTAPYTIFWSDGISSGKRGELQAGTQTINGIGVGANVTTQKFAVTIVDRNGCQVKQDLEVKQPVALAINVTAKKAGCEGTATGGLTVAVTGGTTQYSYSLDGITFQSENTFNALNAGNYLAQVKDANGCMIQQKASIGVTDLQPQPEFYHVQSGGPVQFVNLSLYADSYVWTFGDNSTSTDKDAIHSYKDGGSYQIELTATNKCGSRTIAKAISGVTDIATTSDELNVRVYPNPSTGVVNIAYSSTLGNEQLMIRVSDMSGRVVLTQPWENVINGSRTSLDLNHLSKGVYLLEITGSAKPYSQSVIIAE